MHDMTAAAGAKPPYADDNIDPRTMHIREIMVSHSYPNGEARCVDVIYGMEAYAVVERTAREVDLLEGGNV